MRELGKKERDKRGCLYCADCKTYRKTNRRMCKHAKCPYRELDKFENYEEYFNAKCGALTGLLEQVK